MRVQCDGAYRGRYVWSQQWRGYVLRWAPAGSIVVTVRRRHGRAAPRIARIWRRDEFTEARTR